MILVCFALYNWEILQIPVSLHIWKPSNLNTSAKLGLSHNGVSAKNPKIFKLDLIVVQSFLRRTTVGAMCGRWCKPASKLASTEIFCVPVHNKFSIQSGSPSNPKPLKGCSLVGIKIEFRVRDCSSFPIFAILQSRKTYSGHIFSISRTWTNYWYGWTICGVSTAGNYA